MSISKLFLFPVVNNSAMLVPPRSNIVDCSAILIGRRTEGHGYIGSLQYV